MSVCGLGIVNLISTILHSVGSLKACHILANKLQKVNAKKIKMHTSFTSASTDWMMFKEKVYCLYAFCMVYSRFSTLRMNCKTVSCRIGHLWVKNSMSYCKWQFCFGCSLQYFYSKTAVKQLSLIITSQNLSMFYNSLNASKNN